MATARKSFCNPDFLGDEIMKCLKEYSDEVTEKVKEASEIVAKEVSEEIKSHVTFKGSGAYVKSFRIKTSYEDKRNKRKTWYVASPHYRLTHLLEFGHATRNGDRDTRAFPHVKYGEDLAKRRMVELCEEAVKGDN